MIAEKKISNSDEISRENAAAQLRYYNIGNETKN